MAKISWAGQSCFAISVSNSRDHEANILIDPLDESTGLKTPNLSADILLISQKNNSNVKESVKGEPFVISGPGEYEVKEVFIQGIYSDSEDSAKKNTIYVFESEGIRFCHLGNINQKQLTDEQLEKIDIVDILMVPIGGNGFTIGSAEASKIISQIEPKIVIPMNYALPKLKIELDELSKFLKTMGKASISPQDKLTIKANALPKEGAMEIIVLQP